MIEQNSSNSLPPQGELTPPPSRRRKMRRTVDAPSGPLRVRAYLRVSTEEQARGGVSLPAQQQYLEELCQRRGWQIVGWYREEGRSGKSLERPELQRLLAEMEPGDVVLVYKLDRLTRSVADLDKLLKLFDEKGVLFQSATEVFETITAGGRLFIRLVAEIAQWEREVISERSAMGKRAKVELAQWQGGPVPYGYKGVPTDHTKAGRKLLRLEPDPETAHIVRWIFERYRRGQGVRSICRWLNEKLGVRTKRGAEWRIQTVIRILRNPIYAGYVHHGERSKHSSETIWRRGKHEPLVDEETFRAVQNMFELRHGTAPRASTGRYPLTGVAYCGVCGGKVSMTPGRTPDSYAYRCNNYTMGIGCAQSERGLAHALGRVVEANLLRAMEEWIKTPAALDQYFAALAAQEMQDEEVTAAEIRRLEAEIARARQAIARWDRAFEQEDMPYSEYAEKVAPHKAAIARADEKIAELKKKPAPPKREALVAATTRITQAWQGLEPPERKALLQQFCRAYRVRILIYPDRRVELVPAPPEQQS